MDDMLARISIQKENFKSKVKKFRLEKGLFFWVTLIQAVVAKTLRLFYKVFFCLQILVPQKISLFPLLRAEINGGAVMPPPPSFSFVKYPRPLRFIVQLVSLKQFRQSSSEYTILINTIYLPNSS